MDNPNPIHYSDLIQPDNSIENLIAQLEELIGVYDKARAKIQSSAQQAAQSISNLSGATQEQQKAIRLTTEESDKLVQQYRDLNSAAWKVTDALEQAKAAKKENAQIDKLISQINNSLEGSYDRLSAQYRLNKIRLNEMSAAERENTEAGRKLEAETKAIYEQMNRLQKATGKAQLQVGQYERALGQTLGVNSRWINLLTDMTKATDLFKGAIGILATPLGALIGIIAAATAAFKLFKASVYSTQQSGDALDTEVAGWSATWEVFKKSVATMDFSSFIRQAAQAAASGRELKMVLDEMFERTNSTRLLKASLSTENAMLEEAMRDTRKSYKERLDAADEYLKNMVPIYQMEEDAAKDVRDKQAKYLFDVTNTRKFASEEERKAAQDEFTDNIKNYNLNKDLLEQANAYNIALKGRETIYNGVQAADRKTWENLERRKQAYDETVNSASEDVKAFAEFMAQYQLTNDKEVTAYVDAEEKYQQTRAAAYNDQKRIISLRNNLEAQETAEKERNVKARVSAIKEETEAERSLLDLQKTADKLTIEISITEKGTQERLDKEMELLDTQMLIEIEKNKAKTEREQQDELLIIEKYYQLKLQKQAEFEKTASAIRLQGLQAEQQALQLQIAITEENTQERLDKELELLDKQMLIELEQNKQKAENLQQDELAIIEKYFTLKNRKEADFITKLAKRDLAAQQDLAEQEFSLMDKNERQKTIFKLEQERARLEKLLELDKTATEKMTETEVAAIKKTIEAINKEIGRTGYSNLWEVFGISISSDQQQALSTAFDSVKDSLSSLVDSYAEVAEAAVESANSQVDAAQKVLDAEIEARAQGYANSVDSARQELELAKKTQKQALKEQEKVQKAQNAIDTLQQTTSLITAAANIWKAFSGLGLPGIALATASTALMFGSFVAAKVKAAQVTSEKYGEGTVELLEGGSHASGNDIDLGRKSNGVRRKAEGGEFFAVINKRSSRKYRRLIPEVINSLNDGTFAMKYQRAGAIMASGVGSMTDVSRLEREVTAIRQQGEYREMRDGDKRIIQYKNLTRVIR